MTVRQVNIRKGTTYVFPESACIIALDSSGAVVVIEQAREPVGNITIELPGGVILSQETPLECAQREFYEETGLKAVDSRLLFTLDLDLSTAIHRTHVFHSSIAGMEISADAEFPIRRIPLWQAMDMIGNSEITHAPTVAAVLALHAGYQRR